MNETKGLHGESPPPRLTGLSFCPQLDKARRAYHKVSRKEQAARERDLHAQGNPDISIDKQKKIQEERALVQQEAEKVTGKMFTLWTMSMRWCCPLVAGGGIV